VAQLEQAIHTYLAEHNRKPKPFPWTASAALILGKFQHLCKEIGLNNASYLMMCTPAKNKDEDYRVPMCSSYQKLGLNSYLVT
jgi:hypothetical protein